MSLWRISLVAPFHLVLGLAEEAQGGKVTFEPGHNKAQGSRLSSGIHVFLEVLYLSKKKIIVKGSPGAWAFFFCLNPEGSQCLCWRGL